MGGGSGSSSSTYSPPPEVAAAYKQLLSNAQPLFTAPYQPYTAGKAETASDMVPLTVAPQTPNQVAAGQNIASLAGYYQPYANAATDLVQQGSQPIQLQQFNNQSVGQYMSPFMQNVMGSTVANINETNAQQQQQVLGNAIAKGAYGGDRSGIAQSELARQQNLANNATLANVANTGYNSALGQFNQMNQQGIQAQLGSGQLAQSGAGLLGNLGTAAQNAALNQAQAQYGVGSQQQQQKQAELSTAYQNYMNQIGYPYQQAQFEGGLISGVASGMGGTTTSTPAQPSGMSQAIGGIGALAALGNAGFFGSAAEGTGLMGMLAEAAPAAAILASGGRVHSPENKGYASGGEVQQKELMGVSPIAGISATSYIPTAQMQMANPHMPQAPQTKDPNSDFYSNLAGAVKSVKSMMGKKDSESDTPPQGAVAPIEAPPEGAVAPISSEASLLEAAGGRIHHYGVGGVADTHPDANITAASPHHSDSFDALKASQQHYTQSLPNAGVVPTSSASTGVTGGTPPGVSADDKTPVDPNAAALHNPALARSNYTNLATSGKASLADLQSAYDLYMHSHATPEAITPVQLGSGTPATTDAASSDNSGSSFPEGGGGGGNEGGGPGSAEGPGSNGSVGGRDSNNADSSGQTGGNYAAGGSIVNYAGMPTSKTVKDSAEESFGSGQAGSDATVAALAAEDFLPGKSYGGVIGREHHANPDDTNDYSNVVGKAAGVAAVAPEEGVATGVPRSNIFEGLNANSRAAKNNNPGNIIDSGFARSQPGYAGTDGRFARFETPEHGESAMHGLLQNYQKQGITTPAGIIGKWAPPSDGNDTNSYVAQVAKKLGVSPNDPIDVTDPKVRDILGKTIATVEAGTAGPNAGGATPNRISPVADGQQKTQPQMPSGVNQTATKEGLSGMLGISMTDNQRLAAFNAFAKLAGTPGKFGVGLAAAADTYSKTLMEANKQQRENYTAESEGKLRSSQELSNRVSRQGSVTQVLSTGPDGQVKVENQFIPMGGSATFGGGQQPSVVSGGTSPTGAPSGPSAPMSPESIQKINLLGPVSTADADKNGGVNKFSVIDELAKQARETNAYRNPETVAAKFDEEYRDIQAAANNASSSRANLTSTIKAVSETAPGGLTGFGPFADQRAMFNRVANLGLNTFGITGVNVEGLSNQQILDKSKEIAAQNTANSNAAARWLETLAKTYPNTSLDEGAAKKLTAERIVQSQRALDYQAVANEYGNKSMKMGTNIQGVFDQVNSPNMYAAAQNDIYKLMMKNKDIATPDGKTVRGNPISAYMNGTGTPEQFDAWARQNGSTIANLSRFIPRQTVQ